MVHGRFMKMMYIHTYVIPNAVEVEKPFCHNYLNIISDLTTSNIFVDVYIHTQNSDKWSL